MREGKKSELGIEPVMDFVKRNGTVLLVHMLEKPKRGDGNCRRQ